MAIYKISCQEISIAGGVLLLSTWSVSDADIVFLFICILIKIAQYMRAKMQLVNVILFKAPKVSQNEPIIL